MTNFNFLANGITSIINHSAHYDSCPSWRFTTSFSESTTFAQKDILKFVVSFVVI